MKSQIRNLLIVSIIMTPFLGAFSGCTQPDNPEPVKATTPPAPPTEKELEVPKKVDGKTYGTGARYQKAMNKAQGTGP